MLTTSMTRHASFPPVVDERTHTLVLGSLPGAASLKAGRYYANPRNQFWRLIGEVVGQDLASRDYDARLSMLLDHGFGLWDVIAQAERSGSLDAAIRNAQAHDLQALIFQLPRLRTIGFNGGTAARLGMAQMKGPEANLRLIRLPSSSPAHAVPFEQKLARWRELAGSNSTNDSFGLPDVM